MQKFTETLKNNFLFKLSLLIKNYQLKVFLEVASIQCPIFYIETI